jgi:hypothetical protein
MRVLLAALLLGLPGVAIAEVSDKLPTHGDFAISAIVLAAVTFALSSWRWWWSLLGVVSLVPYIAFIVEIYGAFDLGPAVSQELGVSYFATIVLSIASIAVATLAGGFRGWRKQMANNALERSKFRATAPPGPAAAQGRR